MCLIPLISNAQIPDDHPAMQMRKYYCDVYTGQSIVCFESHDLDSILVVAAKFIEPAQVISLYSYKVNPYKYGNETIFAEALEENRNYSSSLRLPIRGKKDIKTFNNYWSARKYNSDFSRGIPRRDSYWRPREHKS